MLSLDWEKLPKLNDLSKCQARQWASSLILTSHLQAVLSKPLKFIIAVYYPFIMI